MPAKVNNIEAITVMLKADLAPQVPYQGGKIPWLCIHRPCGKLVTPLYNSIKNGQGGCTHCANNRTLDDEKAAAFVTSLGLIPLESYPGSVMQNWNLQAPCGHTVYLRYNDIQQKAKTRKTWCAECSGSHRRPRMDVISETLSTRGWTPLEPYPGAEKPWKLFHAPCNLESTSNWRHIKKANDQDRDGCAHCSLHCPKDCPCRPPKPGRRVVDPEHAAEVMRSHGHHPTEPYPGSMVPWNCIHEVCGNPTTPYYLDIARGRSKGCKHCILRCPKDCGCSVRRGSGPSTGK